FASVERIEKLAHGLGKRGFIFPLVVKNQVQPIAFHHVHAEGIDLYPPLAITDNGIQEPGWVANPLASPQLERSRHFLGSPTTFFRHLAKFGAGSNFSGREQSLLMLSPASPEPVRFPAEGESGRLRPWLSQRGASTETPPWPHPG